VRVRTAWLEAAALSLGAFALARHAAAQVNVGVQLATSAFVGGRYAEHLAWAAGSLELVF
jgi:hypothetical protein